MSRKSHRAAPALVGLDYEEISLHPAPHRPAFGGVVPALRATRGSLLDDCRAERPTGRVSQEAMTPESGFRINPRPAIPAARSPRPMDEMTWKYPFIRFSIVRQSAPPFRSPVPRAGLAGAIAARNRRRATARARRFTALRPPPSVPIPASGPSRGRLFPARGRVAHRTRTRRILHSSITPSSGLRRRSPI